MSVSSLKTAVMTERPKREILRVSSSPGISAMACSIGKVTSCSTSCEAKVGVEVMICTWLLVISGTASMGSLVALHTPQKISIRVMNPTNSLFLMLNSMILSNISNKN